MVRAQPERNAEIIKLWVRGHTQAAIGERMGISQARVSEIIRTHQVKLSARTREEIIQREVETLDELRRMGLEVADGMAAPVVRGDVSIKVDPETGAIERTGIVVDPETGKVVRDHGGRLAGAKLALDASAAMRKLLGADAVVKTDATVNVRYTIDGVDPEDLT